jgi:hypothetical protein
MPRVIVGMEDGLLVTADAEEVEDLEILDATRRSIGMAYWQTYLGFLEGSIRA